MFSLLVRHKVRDYAAWRSGFDAHNLTRRADGALSNRIFQNAADPNEVVVLIEWDGLVRAQLFAQSDDLREALAFQEVLDEPDLWFLTEGHDQVHDTDASLDSSP